MTIITLENSTQEIEIEEMQLLCYYDEVSLYKQPLSFRYLICIFGYIQFGIQLVGYPLLAIIGCVGQVVTIVALLKLKKWKGTCRIYYLTIAFSDLILLVNYPFLDSIYFLLVFMTRDDNVRPFASVSHLTCKISLFWKFFSWFVSCNTLVVFAFERLIVISYPFLRARIATQKRAIIICVTLLIMAICMHVPLALTDLYALIESAPHAPRLCQMVEIESLAWKIAAWTILPLTIFLPPHFLCILNVGLLLKLNNYRKQRKKMIQQLKKQSNKEEKEAKDLVVISAISIALSLPILMWLPFYFPTGKHGAPAWAMGGSLPPPRKREKCCRKMVLFS